nr:hypothetical protein [Tanacetum cinerariifolium]
AQLEAEVLTRSSHSSRTSYAVAADLSEMELKKILIDKMEGNKSIQRSDEHRNLYKALHLEEVYKATTDQLDWVNPEGQQYPHNLLQPLPLIPDDRDRRVVPFEHFINNDLEYLRGGALSRKYTTSVTKTKAADYGHIKWIEDLVPHTMWIQEPLNYDKHALWGVSHWGQKWKLSNLTVEERFAFNVSLRMFIKSIVIQRRMEDLQLGVESYHKRLNLTKPDTLMRIDELHKFSDGTLNDVRNALDDRLKGIRMQYLPTIIWRKGDKDRTAAMIQAIDKMLKTRRIMRSLERFFGGRQYEGDFQEQAKNFQWGLRRSTLNQLMCMPFTDVAQVANAARNYEILHERDDDDAERPDKRQKSGDRHQPTTQQSSHRNHGHNNDRHGSDRRGGSDNHRSSNNNYSGNNNRNSGNGRDQRNRGQ